MTPKTLPESKPSKPLTKSQALEDVKTMSDLAYEHQWTQAVEFAVKNPHVLGARMCRTKKNARYWIGDTFLTLAARTASLDVVRQLVEAGAPLEGRTTKGETALFLALTRLAKFNTQTETFFTVDYLIERGARLNTVNSEGQDPVFLTYADLPSKYIKALIAAGLTFDGWHSADNLPTITQLVYLSENCKLPQRRETLKTVIESGVDLNPKCSFFHQLPLTRALMYGSTDLADLMLAHGANPLAQGLDGRSPLFGAYSSRAVAWVLERHPELLDKRDAQGMTPLMVHIFTARDNSSSFCRGATESIKSLIMAGADLDAIDDQGPLLSKSPRQVIEDGKVPNLKKFLSVWRTASEAKKALQEIEMERSQAPMSPA